MKKYDGSIAADMIEACSSVVERSAALKGIRDFCRYFGGQLLYIPQSSGSIMEEIHGVLRDSVGDSDGGRILEKIITLYGGCQIYVPMEKGAFRAVIAREIYERYDGRRETLRDLCREYQMSFTRVYRLYYEGRDNKAQMKFEFAEEK
jgi:Mor family transcriptional regulator